MKDKILQGLNCCQRSECNFCPYFEDARCTDNLKKDAYNLITEQEKEIEQAYEAYAQGYEQAKNDIIALIKSEV